MALPGYELAEVIGEGAFGSVYRAIQPSVGREVAVKVVRAELADDPRFVQRFEAEAQLVARIEHPHVVPLYDFWRRPGVAFLVFRLLRGGSLIDREAKGPRGLAEAGRLVDELGGALMAAHALGVVHRDVKPANILFDEADNSYLADFGIAQLGAGDGDLDLRSSGSPLYASPEQLRDATASPASDQYSLAVVLWEALSGRSPFAGTTATELGLEKLREPVPALDDAVEGGALVSPVLAKATAPHPHDRYPSIAEFVEAWHTALAGVDLARTTGRPLGAQSCRSVTPTLASLGLTGVNPYKGLRSFQEADAAEFCGRDDLVARLLDRVGSTPFVTVVGPSGSGKSSLVHAGLVPALRRNGALVVSMVPGVDPMLELRSALRRVATAADEGTIDACLRTPGGLTDVARELVGTEGQLVLVVDQFEELWTLAADRVTRDHFAELLAQVGDAPASLRVVATLRADQYDLPLQHPALGPVVSDSTYAVTPMSASELHDAIVAPAERVGVRFEPHLVPTMVGDVVSRPGALPLLQFALTELFEQRRNATITLEAYEELGGIGGAIARRAESLYDATAADRRADVRRLFTQLVTAGDDADDLRRRATLEELSDVDPGVIEAYRASRLLVTDHHPVTREPTIEVAHEALLREWPRLVDWIDEDRDILRVRRGLSVGATEWRMDPADESTLLRGTRLAAADDVARSLKLTHGEQEFLQASHVLADRERRRADEHAAAQVSQNRRLRRVLAATAVLLVVALLAGAFALQQRRRSDRSAATATQARLLADARSLASTDRNVALLLAAEAARREPGVASANALATALLTDAAFLRYEGDPNAPRATLNSSLRAGDVPAFSPDGTQLAVPDSGAKVVRIVDVVTGDLKRELPFPVFSYRSSLRGVEWLPDGLLVLFAAADIVGIDATTGAVRLPAQALEGTLTSWAVSADGRQAALVNDSTGSPTVTVLDLRSGEVLVRASAPCCTTAPPIGPGGIETNLTGVVAWRGNDLYVASGSGTIEQWDPDTGRRLRTLGSDFPAPVSVRFVDGGATLVVSGATAEGDAQLMAYDADTGQAVWDTPQPVAGAITEDPRHAAVIVADPYVTGVLRRFDLASGAPDAESFDTQTGPPCVAVSSADGRYLAAGSCARSRLALWSLGGGGAAFHHLTDSLLSVGGPIFNRDGSYAVLSASDGRLDPSGPTELDLASGDLTHVDLPSGYLPSMAFTPDYHLAVVTEDAHMAYSVDEVVQPSEPFAIDTPSPSRLRGQLAATDQLGDLVVVRYRGDAHRLWVSPDVHRSDEVAIDYVPGTIGSFVISPDGERLLVGGTEGVRVFDLGDGRLVDQPFAGYQLAIDQRRHVLAVSGLDGTIRLRDATTLALLGSVIAAPPGSAVALAPDGSLLKVVDASRHLRLYDVATHAPIGPPIDLGDGSDSEILPHGDSMLLQRDGAIVELSLDPDTLFDRACLAAGRNLSADEWATYIGGSPRATCPRWPAPGATNAARTSATTVAPASLSTIPVNVASPPTISVTAASSSTVSVAAGAVSTTTDAEVAATVQPGAIERIVARGDLPPSPAPVFGASSGPDDPLPFTATYQLVGDLTGTVSVQGSMLVDSGAGTFTQFETIGTFSGSLKGVGRGTLIVTTTVPETHIIGEETVESGTVSDGTGAFAGFEGTIENRFTFDDDGQPVGTYTVTLERSG